MFKLGYVVRALSSVTGGFLDNLLAATRSSRKAPSQHSPPLAVEMLEGRTLLSAGLTTSLLGSQGLQPGNVHFVGDGHDHPLFLDADGNPIFVDGDLPIEDVLSLPGADAPPVVPQESIEGDDDVSQVNDGTFDLSRTFKLHSNAAATHKIYLDFNGHTTSGTYWNYYYSDNDPIQHQAWSQDGNRSSFSSSEQATIQRIWAAVAEDFAPFNVDVTTEDPGAAALIKSGANDVSYGVRVVIGPNGWYPSNAGGVAFVNSFNWSTDTPAFVFNSSEVGVREAVSHEIGHTLGLSHDGLNGSSYHSGDNGNPSWGPIMGAPYYTDVTQWSRGQYQGATQTQDDLQIITTQNGFGYRSDDVGGTQATALALAANSANKISAHGIIERSTDVDVYSFTTGAGNVNIDVHTAQFGANLDVLARLYDSSWNLVAQSNPASSLEAGFSLNLSQGTYYLSIDGVGRGNPLGSSTGYTDYASLGNYWICGTVAEVASGNNGGADNGGGGSGNGNGSGEVTYVDFDGGGLWRHSAGDGWQKISSGNVAQLLVGQDGSVYADFDGGGLWRYVHGAGWTKLSSGNVSQMRLSSDGTLFADFDGGGFWSRAAGEGWTLLSGGNVSQMILAANGTLYADFDGGGFWSRAPGEGWTRLSGGNVAQMILADNGTLYADFDGGGFWSLAPGEGWTKLSGGNVAQMILTANGTLYADFDGGGLWSRSAGAGWTRLSGGNVIRMQVSDDDVLYADFGGGLWRHEDGQGWTLLSTGKISQIMVSADGILYADFDGGGFWRYTESDGWSRIIHKNAAQMRFTGSGQVHVDFDFGGLWRYVEGQGWTQIHWGNAGGFWIV